MIILDESNSISKVLLRIENRKLCIVTAFAAGTEEYIDHLLKNGNSIDMILGSINAFSSPSFIDHHVQKANTNYRLSVDFRYENSTHWKVYLIEPNVVIVGSSNFTKKGLSMDRDTCVYIENSNLYNDYIKRIKSLRKLKKVMQPSDEGFDSEFEKYKMIHRKSQNSLSKVSPSRSISAWLDSETNQLVPLFIWEGRHDNETKVVANELVSEISSKETSLAETEVIIDLRDFFTMGGEFDDFPYEEGSSVLCMSTRGQYLEFHTFDRIIQSDGKTFMFSFKRESGKYPRPFQMSKNFKLNLISMTGELYDRDCRELTRNMIAQLDTQC